MRRPPDTLDLAECWQTSGFDNERPALQHGIVHGCSFFWGWVGHYLPVLMTVDDWLYHLCSTGVNDFFGHGCIGDIRTSVFVTSWVLAHFIAFVVYWALVP